MLVRYQRAAGAVWRNAHGCAFVLPQPGSEIVVLAGTGHDLWRLLAEPMSIDQVAHCLAETYDVPADAVTRDVAPILDELASRGVLDEE